MQSHSTNYATRNAIEPPRSMNSPEGTIQSVWDVKRMNAIIKRSNYHNISDGYKCDSQENYVVGFFYYFLLRLCGYGNLRLVFFIADWCDWIERQSFLFADAKAMEGTATGETTTISTMAAMTALSIIIWSNSVYNDDNRQIHGKYTDFQLRIRWNVPLFPTANKPNAICDRIRDVPSFREQKANGMDRKVIADICTCVLTICASSGLSLRSPTSRMHFN